MRTDFYHQIVGGFIFSEQATAPAEYAVILALVVVVSLVSILMFGFDCRQLLDHASQSISGPFARGPAADAPEAVKYFFSSTHFPGS